MQNLCYSVFAIATMFATVGCIPSGSGISQVGMNIYPDAQSYHAARAQRGSQRLQQQTDGAVAYTVQHPRNPNKRESGISNAFWNRPAAQQQPIRNQQQNYYRPQPVQQNNQEFGFRNNRNRQNGHSNFDGNRNHFQSTPASLPRELPVEAKVQVIRNQNRLYGNHRFSAPHWLRARETTEEMRQNLNLIDALDPSQPLRYY